MNKRIFHPWIAFAVIFGIAVMLNEYGIVNGSLFLFDFFAGIAIYKIFTFPR